MLEITGLTRAYGQLPAVSDLTFTMPRGQLVALTGPSGCGKSTLLRCIASPGRIGADLAVDLPAPRDQLTTREHPAFTRLRSQALRLIRTQPGPQDRASHPLAPAEEP